MRLFVIFIAALMLASQRSPERLPVYTYRVVRTYPHDTKAFTQGLQYVNGFLYEGTGRNGSSTIRKVKLETGEVLQRRDLARADFGEGITILNNDLNQVQWQSYVAFTYDSKAI